MEVRRRNPKIRDRKEYIENKDNCLKKMIFRVYLKRARRKGKGCVGGSKIGRSKIRKK